MTDEYNKQTKHENNNKKRTHDSIEPTITEHNKPMDPNHPSFGPTLSAAPPHHRAHHRPHHRPGYSGVGVSCHSDITTVKPGNSHGVN